MVLGSFCKQWPIRVRVRVWVRVWVRGGGLRPTVGAQMEESVEFVGGCS